MKSLSTPVRVVVTTLVVGGCVGCCMVCWLGAPNWSHAVLGRYSVKWFIGASATTTILVLATLAVIRSLWSRPSLATCDHHHLSFGKEALFAGITLILVLLGIEVGLRCFGFPSQPRPFRPPGGTTGGFHALLQQVDRAHHGGTWSRSYHGRVFEREKTAQIRIICLGGSTTWGHHLDGEDSWPAILEEYLRVLGYDVEIINAGYPWYTTVHSIANYTLQMRYYNPDIVIVMHGVNDLARSFPAPGEPPPEWDYGSYQGPMRNVLAGYRAYNRKRSWANWHPARLLSSSAIYRLLIEQKAARVEQPDVQVGIEAFPTLESFRAHLEYLTRLCLDDHRLVLLATQAHIYDHEDLTSLPDFIGTIREVYMQVAKGQPISASSLRNAMRAVRETTIDVARRFDVPLTDVERAIDGKIEYFMDDFHLNADGNAVATRAFADVLRPILDELQGLHPSAKSPLREDVRQAFQLAKRP
ncbi:MAG: GDSL-type esterase/lipase family protein [Phycisphaerae bacterium]